MSLLKNFTDVLRTPIFLEQWQIATSEISSENQNNSTG